MCNECDGEFVKLCGHMCCGQPQIKAFIVAFIQIQYNNITDDDQSDASFTLLRDVDVVSGFSLS